MKISSENPGGHRVISQVLQAVASVVVWMGSDDFKSGNLMMAHLLRMVFPSFIQILIVITNLF